MKKNLTYLLLLMAFLQAAIAMEGDETPESHLTAAPTEIRAKIYCDGLSFKDWVCLAQTCKIFSHELQQAVSYTMCINTHREDTIHSDNFLDDKYAAMRQKLLDPKFYESAEYKDFKDFFKIIETANKSAKNRKAKGLNEDQISALIAGAKKYRINTLMLHGLKLEKANLRNMQCRHLELIGCDIFKTDFSNGMFEKLLFTKYGFKQSSSFVKLDGVKAKNIHINQWLPESSFKQAQIDVLHLQESFSLSCSDFSAAQVKAITGAGFTKSNYDSFCQELNFYIVTASSSMIALLRETLPEAEERWKEIKVVDTVEPALAEDNTAAGYGAGRLPDFHAANPHQTTLGLTYIVA